MVDKGWLLLDVRVDQHYIVPHNRQKLVVEHLILLCLGHDVVLLVLQGGCQGVVDLRQGGGPA